MRPESGPTPSRVAGEARTDWNETVIAVGKGDEGFDVSPDGSRLWTANAQGGTVSIVDLASMTVIATLDAKVFGANRLKFAPDGKLVLISSLGHGDLVIYDAQRRTELRRVAIGHGAAGILMDLDGSRAFVACSPDNHIVVVDLKSFQVTGYVDVGAEESRPFFIAEFRLKRGGI